MFYNAIYKRFEPTNVDFPSHYHRVEGVNRWTFLDSYYTIFFCDTISLLNYNGNDSHRIGNVRNAGSVVGPDSNWIRIQEGKNYPQK